MPIERPRRPRTRLLPFDEMATILTQTGMEKFEEIQKEFWEAFDYSDGGRLPYEIAGVRNETLTYEKLDALGITAKTLACLVDEPTNEIHSSEIVPLFWFVAGDHKVWGYERTNRYFIEGNPNCVFGHKPWS